MTGIKLDTPKNVNYSCQVVRIPALVTLPGLDNLVGVPVLGHQALTEKTGKQVGDLALAFTAETQLSDGYAAFNNLYRSEELNSDKAERGYLEANRRIRAIKLRGHRSDALLMPLSSLGYTGADWRELKEGDAFDQLNGHEICRKYEIPVKRSSPAQSKIDKAFKRVTDKLFPRHLETSQFWREKHLLRPGREVVVTQKLHGCLLRVGRVPVLRQLTWRERLAKRLGVRVDDYEYDAVFGSNRVIKDSRNPDQRHWYGHDAWTEYGEKIVDLLPDGYLLYGELIGWTKNAEGKDIPIQQNYTYHLSKGQNELFVYRVAQINHQGVLSDLPWDGVREFCEARGMKWTPEMCRVTFGIGDEGAVETLDELSGCIDDMMDRRYRDHYDKNIADAWPTIEPPVPLSDKKTVDEGVCLRQEGIVPTILKAKSPKFLEHETKLLDKGEQDIESAA